MGYSSAEVGENVIQQNAPEVPPGRLRIRKWSRWWSSVRRKVGEPDIGALVTQAPLVPSQDKYPGPVMTSGVMGIGGGGERGGGKVRKILRVEKKLRIKIVVN